MTSHMIGEVDFEPASPPGRAKGLEIEFSHVASALTNHAYILKTLDPKFSGASRLVNTLLGQDGDAAQSNGDTTPSEAP